MYGHVLDMECCAPLVQVMTDRKMLQLKRKAEAEAEQKREDDSLAALNNRSANANSAFLQNDAVAQRC